MGFASLYPSYGLRTTGAVPMMQIQMVRMRGCAAPYPVGWVERSETHHRRATDYGKPLPMPMPMMQIRIVRM